VERRDPPAAVVNLEMTDMADAKVERHLRSRNIEADEWISHESLILHESDGQIGVTPGRRWCRRA
jgi:hypothetical protein